MKSSTRVLEDPARLGAFLKQHARLERHPLVPELELYQASRLDAVWEAAETTCALRLAPPFWAFSWPGGLALARYLLDHRDIVAQRQLLDIGCGNGCVAVAAARAGARVTAYDIDRVALATTRFHAQHNRLEVETPLIDALEPVLASGAFQVVCVGDGLYENTSSRRLLRLLFEATRGGVAVLIGDPGRGCLPGTGLEPLAEYPIETSTDLEGSALRIATVFQMQQAGDDNCSKTR